MDKKAEKFAGQIQKALGGDLKSFIVYGSAATGEVYKDSDCNTIMVLNTLNTGLLKKISGPISSWVRKGQPIPLIFTAESMKASQDVFPVEFLDIKENHLVLHGDDDFKDMAISMDNLRLEIEREIKSKLIRLRQSYILTGGNPSKVRVLLIRSISTFIALLKGIIRLYGKNTPSKKNEIIDAAPDAIKLNKALFKTILSAKEHKTVLKPGDMDAIFTDYMAEIDRVADIIDKK